MTISIWRYSHLALAVSSFAFILLASITGIILAFQPISEQIQPYKSADFETATIAETLSTLKKSYSEIIDLQIDANDFVLASVITENGESKTGYINPKTAQFLGNKIEVSPFFQWVTNFHRSLFLKSTGRFLVGLCSFLLFLIAVSGSVLILKRQRSFKKFFSKIVNENFNQYWHIVLGRLSLIPIIIITITGVYLSLEKFNLLPTYNTSHNINYDAISESPQLELHNFPVFKNTKLSEVKFIEFPFSDDVEDYFTIALQNREIVVNQFTGEILSEFNYPLVTFYSELSLNLHTGKGSILWSLILAIATANILFFIYSGFAMTLKRRKAKLKNKFKKDVCDYVILVGSENGSTLPFANVLHEQLLHAGKKSYITEMNNYTTFIQAEHIIILTATYGLGDPPTNANRFLELLKTTKQSETISYSVVGFGSYAYPDFCKFALDVDSAIQLHFKQFLPVFTINDKSVDAFKQWTNAWTEKMQVPVKIAEDKLTSKPRLTNSLTVIHKTEVINNPDSTFLLTLKAKKAKRFVSGDLLAIYPANDYRERLYSIGKVDGNIQLSVKYYDTGLGSNFLNGFDLGDTFKARIINNAAFHFPKKAANVVMIANGTGIAPFLGMLDANIKRKNVHLYFGLRTKQSLELYNSQLESYLQSGKLSRLEMAFSREIESSYVQDLLLKDEVFIAKRLKNKGVLMICGSLTMQNGVLTILETICKKYQLEALSLYQKNGQIQTDCY
ncbi:FAD-binding oxidoreductase [Bizionia argentinensis JUB59]|uniref:FAD-binding oxidoreductase n=1 Tax=Bizionia argentinensis JUB59 TaxID=1046627 RepID=G2EF68_9FLAO|nr:PepSY domain-containing protein [Bizionia argentinensis]EGV42845.1 FAD-binding oxidoreductase [Bizionia argentinensis JUB59]